MFVKLVDIVLRDLNTQLHVLQVHSQMLLDNQLQLLANHAHLDITVMVIQIH